MATAQTEAQISRLYAAGLNRTPDTVGLAYWDQAADNGWSIPQIADWFAHSPEFIQDYGALSDADFVQQLYVNILGRASDAPGAAYWINDLAAGDTRGNILNGFAQSQENITHSADLAAAKAAPAQSSVPIATPTPAAAPAKPVVIQSIIAPPPAPAPVVTPPPAPEPAAPTPLPDVAISGVQTVTTPGAFVLASPAIADPSPTLVTTHANADASTFKFEGWGGRLELSDVQFDGWKFISKWIPDPAVTSALGREMFEFAAGGQFILDNHGTQVAAINVVSSNVVQSTFIGTDQATGYSFIHSG